MKKPSARDYALVNSLVNSACDDSLCRSLDHIPGEHHNFLTECPALARVRAAWTRIVAAQEPKKEKP